VAVVVFAFCVAEEVAGAHFNGVLVGLGEVGLLMGGVGMMEGADEGQGL
jgi:hypothetical protein